MENLFDFFSTHGQVIAAIIGAIGVVIAAIIGYMSQRRTRRKLQQAESEVTLQRAAMDFAQFMEEWHETTHEIERLFKETNIDRFLILRAWNGSLDPRWTTAVFQMREGDQEVVSYVHYELDVDYVSRLREISLRNTMQFNVCDLPSDSDIKHIYENEGVTAAIWSHIDTRKVGKDSSAITYCSFATHDGTIDEATAFRCKLIAGRLKGVSGGFYAS
jgi:hypothetical protein